MSQISRLSCCDGECCDPNNCEFCCDGTCCDQTNCEICKDGSCVRAVPTNMRQTYVEDRGGTLHFEYEWNSTTGDLSDLGNCSVREKVDYPGGDRYYWPSPPWDGWVHNPTILPNPPIPGTHGALQDTHSPPAFKKPYQNASATATQVYQYHCSPSCCMGDDNWETLLNIGSINRWVTGEGEVCGGDPNKKCCDGSCCDKVWTKETHTAINESCPSVADCPEVGCDGTIVTDQPSYDSCLNVGVGEGEHCDCNDEMQVVGKKYTCQEDWDWSMMASCALEAVLCSFQCAGTYADPASCADCLGMLELDCCGGDTCHICDFLESCDPTNAKDIKKPVFINFGDCG